MPNDPFLRSLAFVVVGVAALFVLAGLVIAVGSPFWAYRYLSAPEPRAPGLISRWLWETAKGELFAAGIIAIGVAIGVLVFSPADSPLRTLLLWVSLAVSLIWVIAVPFLEYRRLFALENRDAAVLRSWLRATVRREVPTIYLILACLYFFLPEGSPLLRFLMSTPVIVVFLISIAIQMVMVFRSASRTGGAGT